MIKISEVHSKKGVNLDSNNYNTNTYTKYVTFFIQKKTCNVLIKKIGSSLTIKGCSIVIYINKKSTQDIDLAYFVVILRTLA